MDATVRQLEATALQCLADTRAAETLRFHAGPDHRELVLSDLVERELQGYASFRRFEHECRAGWADAPTTYDVETHAALDRIRGLHMEVGRGVVRQLDASVASRLRIRNALAFRRDYALLASLEALDHGMPHAGLGELAEAAIRERDAGNAPEIDPDDRRNGVTSLRTWDFVKATAALPEDVQTLAELRYRAFFGLDDRHEALSGRPLVGDRPGEGRDLWSVEITFDHRAVAVVDVHPADERRRYLWFFIGTPSELPCGDIQGRA